jgi:hypothetical protein
MHYALSNALCRECEKHDEIRTFCNAGIALLSTRDEKFSRMRVKFCIDIARCGDICTGKNNFQNLPCKWCARTGIEQKMSESALGDSHRTQLSAGNFYAIARADLFSRRNLLLTRAKARRINAALHTKRIPARVYHRARQSPSFFFKSSLTNCGLALPPKRFMTWPTNHIIAFGLALASATLSGFSK